MELLDYFIGPVHNNMKIQEKLNTSYSYHSIQIPLHIEKNMYFDKELDKIKDSDLYHEGKPELNYFNQLEYNDSFGKENEPHCTLLYGLTNECDYFKICQLFNNLNPINITIGTISVFNNDKYDVVKLDVISNRLEKIHYYLRTHYSNENTFPVYKPHITLAYVKKGYGNKYITKSNWTGTKYTIREAEWSHADGYKLPLFFKK